VGTELFLHFVNNLVTLDDVNLLDPNKKWLRMVFLIRSKVVEYLKKPKRV